MAGAPPQAKLFECQRPHRCRRHQQLGKSVEAAKLLDDITYYWFTNTGVSSARLYWENKVGFFDVKNVSVPAAVSSFAHEIYKVPRSWAERAYPNLIYFNEVDRGNHFAAWKEPELFAAEVRAGFQPLREPAVV